MLEAAAREDAVVGLVHELAGVVEVVRDGFDVQLVAVDDGLARGAGLGGPEARGDGLEHLVGVVGHVCGCGVCAGGPFYTGMPLRQHGSLAMVSHAIHPRVRRGRRQRARVVPAERVRGDPREVVLCDE